LELRLVDASVEEPLSAALLVAPRAERTDVVRLRRERAGQQREVELVVVCEDDDRSGVIRCDLRECVLGPGDDDLVGTWKAVTRREARARIGDDRPPADRLRGGAECVGRVDGPIDEQARRAAETRRPPTRA